MTTANREGSLVTVNMIRTAIRTQLDDAGWLSYYMAEAERAEGITPGEIARPASWEQPTELQKWPESQIPCLLIAVVGTNGPERERGEGEITAPFGVMMGAACRGVDEEDTWRIASVYGAALRQFGAKQLSDLPTLDIEGVSWDDSGEQYGGIPQERSRSLRMASVAFTLQVNGVVSTWPGVDAPPVPPLGDPGPYPAVSEVDVTVDRLS
jgi:hypothetical protein